MRDIFIDHADPEQFLNIVSPKDIVFCDLQICCLYLPNSGKHFRYYLCTPWYMLWENEFLVSLTLFPYKQFFFVIINKCFAVEIILPQMLPCMICALKCIREVQNRNFSLFSDIWEGENLWRGTTLLQENSFRNRSKRTSGNLRSR